MAPEILDKITIYNKRAQETDSGKILLSSGLDFAEEYFANPLFQPIDQLIITKQDKDKKSFIEAEKNALNELESIHDETKDYCIKKGIKLESNFEAYGNKDPRMRIYSTWDVLREKWYALKGELTFLMEQDKSHATFVSRFADIKSKKEVYSDVSDIELDENGFRPKPLKKRTIWNVILKLKKYDIWFKEKNKLDRLQKREIWYHRNVFVETYEIYKNGEDIIEKCFDEKGQIKWECLPKRDYYLVRLEAIEDVLNGDDSEEKFLEATGAKKEDFRIALQKMVFFTKEKLSNPEESKKTSTQTDIDNKPEASIPKDDFSIDEADGILCVKNEKFDFSEALLEKELLVFFFPNGNLLEVKVNKEEVFKYVYDREINDSKKDYDKLYALVKSVNSKLFSILGINFFIFKNGFLRVNEFFFN